MLDPATIQEILKAHIEQTRRQVQDWDRLRALYDTTQWGVTPTTPGVGKDDEIVTESGAVYAYVDSMVSSVVPPNPQVTMLPRRQGLEKPAKYREALVNDLFKRTDAGAVLWKLATHAGVYPRGVLKAVWNHDRRRPDFLVIDPRHFFFDQAAARWEDVRYCIEVTVLTEAEFAQRVNPQDGSEPVYDGNVAGKAQFSSFPQWLQSVKTGRAEVSERIRKVFQWTVVFEVYDFTTPEGRYYHMLEDVREPLFSGDPPYVFVRNPFHMLVFNDNLEDVGGMSDAGIVEGPIRRLDELRTLKLRFVQTSIPITVLNETYLDDPENDEDQLSNQTNPGDIARIKTKQGAKIDDALTYTQTPQLSPSFDIMERGLEEEILFRLGMPQYTRGITGTSDVATELALADAALRTRQGRRSELVNRIIIFMARSAIGLYEEFLDPMDTLPIRLGGQEFMELARQHLAARNPEMAEAQLRAGSMPEEPVEIDYVVAPYSPVENNKIAQLKKLKEFLEALLALGVDRDKLRRKMIELLDMPADLADVPLQPMAPPGQEGAAAPPAGPEAGLGSMGAPEGVATAGGAVPGVPVPPGASIPFGQRPGMVGGAGMPAPAQAK